MRISQLRAISENATGYYGGPAVDMHEYLTLDECTGALPVAIMESQMELSDFTRDTNDALTEAVIESIQYEREFDPTAIVESAVDGLLGKVKKFFEKVINFIKSIIAKLKIFMDRIFMKAKDLYAKYEKEEVYTSKEPKGLSVTAWKFPLRDKTKLWEHDPAEFAKKDQVCSMYNSLFKDLNLKLPNDAAATIKTGRGSDSDSVFKAQMDKMSDISTSEAQYTVINYMVGSSYAVSEKSWERDIKKALYGGEKVTVKYGDECFTKSDLHRVLTSKTELEDIKNKYEKMESAVSDAKADFEKAISNFKNDKGADGKQISGGVKSYEKQLSDAEKRDVDVEDHYNADIENHSRFTNAMSDFTSYTGKLLTFFQNAYGCITKLKDIETTYYKDRLAQAKMMFGKILSWNDKKKDNSDASDIEAAVLADFDL